MSDTGVFLGQFWVGLSHLTYFFGAKKEKFLKRKFFLTWAFFLNVEVFFKLFLENFFITPNQNFLENPL